MLIDPLTKPAKILSYPVMFIAYPARGIPFGICLPHSLTHTHIAVSVSAFAQFSLLFVIQASLLYCTYRKKEENEWRTNAHHANQPEKDEEKRTKCKKIIKQHMYYNNFVYSLSLKPKRWQCYKYEI